MKKIDKWIEDVLKNISDEDKKESVRRELETKIHDLTFNNSEEKVLKRLKDPNDYYKLHYENHNDNKFFKVILIIGILLIMVGLVFLNVVINNRALYDHFVTTSFGVSAGPIYFGGMLVGIGILFIYSSIHHFKKK